MKSVKNKSPLAATLLLVAALASTLFSVSAMCGGVVIVNAENTNKLDAKTIAKIFLGKKKDFPDGSPAVAVDIKGNGEIRNSFVKNVLKKSNQQIKAYWSKLLFTGKGRPPKEIENKINTKCKYIDFFKTAITLPHHNRVTNNRMVDNKIIRLIKSS